MILKKSKGKYSVYKALKYSKLESEFLILPQLPL